MAERRQMAFRYILIFAPLFNSQVYSCTTFNIPRTRYSAPWSGESWKKNTTARLYGSSVKLGKLRTIKLLPEPPTKWRRSYSCRREDTALMVSPYGRFLNTTEQENWKRWQINSLRKQPSEGRGARKDDCFWSPTPNFIKVLCVNSFISMPKG